MKATVKFLADGKFADSPSEGGVYEVEKDEVKEVSLEHAESLIKAKKAVRVKVEKPKTESKDDGKGKDKGKK